MPNSYITQVGALGDNLSAGEKQRIGLARAFLKGSELILLDEPTSNVDSINEGIILKALKEQKSKKSIILVHTVSLNDDFGQNLLFGKRTDARDGMEQYEIRVYTKILLGCIRSTFTKELKNMLQEAIRKA